MNNDELTKEQANAVLQALNDAIEQGPWKASNFLQVIEKNLTKIRDEFGVEIESAAKKNNDEKNDRFARKNELQVGQKKVYVGLYSSNGKNLQSWEWIVTNLPRQMVSRPIYAEEEQARAIIKTKENRTNESYLSIYVDEADILPIPQDKIPHDKLGQARLLLKDGALKLDKIDSFVHESGVYQYAQGRLVKSSKT